MRQVPASLAANKIEFGLIAEDVEQINPNLVYYNENNEPETVYYQYLPILLLNEIKKLKEKHPKIVIAACFPDVFWDEEVELMSIAEAKLMLGNIDPYSVYKWCIDHNHKGNCNPNGQGNGN